MTNEVAERLLRGRRNGAQHGRAVSGCTPYGYKRVLTKSGESTLAPHPEESKVLKKIFRHYLRLRSLQSLCRYLKQQGYKTRRGKDWSRAGLAWILKNPIYIGNVRFGAINRKGLHRALIRQETFDKVAEVLQRNNKHPGQKKPSRSRKCA